MKHLSILVTRQTNLASMDNPRRGFLFINELLQQQGKPPLFDINIVGMEKEVVLDNGWYSLRPDVVLEEVPDTDLILIPAFDGDLEEAIRQNQAFLPWIIQHYKNGAELASLCVGAFLLAATGLLKGKICSTHWQSAEAFRAAFPEVNLQTEKVITDQDGLYTSGGAFSSANLVLYLIEKYGDRAMAIQCSKMFQVDIDRERQSPFIIFKGQKRHNDDQIKQVQQYIEENYQNKITVNELCREVGLSRRSCERRFKKATGNTIVQYIQRIKIEAVKKQLESTRKTVTELMYEVGYADMKSFRNVFHKVAGLSPVEYKRKFNKETHRQVV